MTVTNKLELAKPFADLSISLFIRNQVDTVVEDNFVYLPPLREIGFITKNADFISRLQ